MTACIHKHKEINIITDEKNFPFYHFFPFRISIMLGRVRSMPPSRPTPWTNVPVFSEPKATLTISHPDCHCKQDCTTEAGGLSHALSQPKSILVILDTDKGITLPIGLSILVLGWDILSEISRLTCHFKTAAFNMLIQTEPCFKEKGRRAGGKICQYNN